MKPLNHPSIPGFSLEAKPNERFSEYHIAYLEKISNGVSMREAGANLDLVYGSTRNYQSDLLDLLDARNIAQATFKAFERRLLLPKEPESLPSEPLEPLDIEVLKYVTQGLLSPEIAVFQSRGYRKIYESRQRIYRVYGVESMPHAIRHGIEIGDLELPDSDETQHEV